jgi:glycosyltransferase involved in cell wall biosynthesis
MGDRSLCQTPSVYKRLSRISNAKIKRIDGSVDADAVRSAINSESDQNLRVDKNRVEMIFVGRLVEIKSPAKIPSIVAQLPPVYSLRMIGDGPQRPAVENAIREANVGTRVDIAGRLSHEQTLRAIHDADLLLLPSKADAYPAVVFEALSLNTPVLGTPVGILPSLDHPLLKTTKLENFRRIILEHDWTSKNGINEQDLDRFSVTRFSNEVRSELLNAVCDT